jgi:hypothetical protein
VQTEVLWETLGERGTVAGVEYDAEVLQAMGMNTPVVSGQKEEDDWKGQLNDYALKYQVSVPLTLRIDELVTIISAVSTVRDRFKRHTLIPRIGTN